ncbi:MAG TPA: FIST N-terminal domain-containing protein [Accumulibacter sp.]|nr:FIST N-terminal domain-containing protein [Accumulibacter sp.]HQC80274.1 FIST N-terminal domain-containing protein [Accumulibacter sp.]
MNEPRPLYCGRPDTAGLSDSLRDWRSAGMPGGALVLLPEAEKDRLPSIQAVLAAEGIAHVGAIFPALVKDDGFLREGALLLPFDRLPATALIPSLPADAAAAARRIADAVEPHIAGNGTTQSTLFMIFDAMVPTIGSILDALYLRLADRVAYAGVNAGSETFQPMPCLFDSRESVSGGVLCLLLPDGRGAVLDHGYDAPQDIVTATATEGNRVIGIDWRPAFEVYREQVRGLYDVDLNRENFYEYATHFPFGILLANNDVVVRIPVALEDDGSLFCVGEVPANSMLTLLNAPRIDSVRSVNRLAALLREGFGGVGERHLLTFYCAGRHLHLGADSRRELGRLREETRAPALVGALSLGEIGSLTPWGYPLFHNATLVCRPWN